jgi:hypothetical protein
LEYYQEIVPLMALAARANQLAQDRWSLVTIIPGFGVEAEIAVPGQPGAVPAALVMFNRQNDLHKHNGRSNSIQISP